MITDTQLNMIKFELANRTREDIEREGVDKVIRQIMQQYHLKPTAKNYNSLAILIKYKK